MAENRGHTAAGRDAGDRRHVGRERDSGQRALPHDDRVHELDGDVLRIGARPAGAEDHELAAPVEPDRHLMARCRNSGCLLSELEHWWLAAIKEAADLRVRGPWAGGPRVGGR